MSNEYNQHNFLTCHCLYEMSPIFISKSLKTEQILQIPGPAPITGQSISNLPRHTFQQYDSYSTLLDLESRGSMPSPHNRRCLLVTSGSRLGYGCTNTEHVASIYRPTTGVLQTRRQYHLDPACEGFFWESDLIHIAVEGVGNVLRRGKLSPCHVLDLCEHFMGVESVLQWHIILNIHTFVIFGVVILIIHYHDLLSRFPNVFHRQTDRQTELLLT